MQLPTEEETINKEKAIYMYFLHSTGIIVDNTVL